MKRLALLTLVSLVPLFAFSQETDYEKGERLLDEGNSKEAIEPLSNALAADPTNYHAAYNLGVAYMNVEEYESSVRSFSKAIEIMPNDPDSYFNKAEALLFLGEAEESIPYFEKAIALGSLDTYRYYYWAKAYAETGYCEKALEILDKGIRYDSNMAANYFDKGWCLMILDRPSEAIPWFRKSLVLDPEDEVAYLNIGICYTMTDETELSLAHFDTCIALNPDYVEGYSARANLRMDLGADDSVLTLIKADLDSAFKRDPKHRDILLNYGIYYIKKKDYRQSAKFFDRARMVDRNSAKAYAGRAAANAMALMNKKTSKADWTRIDNDILRALELDATEPLVHYFHGIVYTSKADKDKACDAFRRAAFFGMQSANTMLHLICE